MDHETLNRWLATVTMILVSVVMIGAVYTYVQARQAISSFGGGSPVQEQEQECFDPGGGTVCVP